MEEYRIEVLDRYKRMTYIRGNGINEEDVKKRFKAFYPEYKIIRTKHLSEEIGYFKPKHIDELGERFKVENN